jgi:protein tyrosine phosphatase (PTP) superfamily phosphohydrolase (DUF442 family)
MIENTSGAERPFQNAVALLFPGVDVEDINRASEEYGTQIVVKEPFSETKDYARFFKRSKREIEGAGMTMLFIFPDGTASHATDIQSLKKALKRATREARRA